MNNECKIYLGGSEKLSVYKYEIEAFLKKVIPNISICLPERNLSSISNVAVITNTEVIETALIHLHIVTPEDLGLRIGAEVMQSLISNPKGTILFVKATENNKVFSLEERKELYILCDYVNYKKGVTILNDVSLLLETINTLIATKVEWINYNKSSVINDIIDDSYKVIEQSYPNYVLNGRPKLYSIINTLNYLLKNERSNT
jgi:hypothetical protein